MTEGYRYQVAGELRTAEDIPALIRVIYYEGAHPPPEGAPPALSRYRDQVPLYDRRRDQIWPVHWENVYQRVFEDDYRFLHPESLRLLEGDNLRIASWYDPDLLQHTYYQVFYSSAVRDRHITYCRRPSYYPGVQHISPYYSVDELLYMAYDWNLISSETEDHLDETRIAEICPLISAHDIPAETLIAHQLYIYQQDAIGLVQYYSLFGSYYIGQYLRRTDACLRERDCDTPRNLVLEGQIERALAVVYGAPPLTREHTVYRFVNTDSFWYGLQPGDTWTENSFTSTTRNPFYYQDACPFGKILSRIRLPAGVRGVGLCIEAYSNFPWEEEVILAPTNIYRLERVTTDVQNTEYHRAFRLQVVKKYDWVWVGRQEQTPVLHTRHLRIPETPLVNPEDLLRGDWQQRPLATRLSAFTRQWTDVNGQFRIYLSGRERVLSLASYNSAGVYAPYFWYSREDGVMITGVNREHGHINLLLEVGPDLHLNYYARHSVSDSGEVIDLDHTSSLRTLACLAAVLGCRHVYYHSDYQLTYTPHSQSDPADQIIRTRYTTPAVTLRYLRSGEKTLDYREVTPGFDYYQLDILGAVNPGDYLSETDRDPLWGLWRQHEWGSVREMWLWVVEHRPDLRRPLEDHLTTLYGPEDNPWTHLYHRLDPWALLVDAALVSAAPPSSSWREVRSHRKLIRQSKIDQFQNRLRYLPART